MNGAGAIYGAAKFDAAVNGWDKATAIGTISASAIAAALGLWQVGQWMLDKKERREALGRTVIGQWEGIGKRYTNEGATGALVSVVNTGSLAAINVRLVDVTGVEVSQTLLCWELDPEADDSEREVIRVLEPGNRRQWRVRFYQGTKEERIKELWAPHNGTVTIRYTDGEGNTWERRETDPPKPVHSPESDSRLA